MARLLPLRQVNYIIEAYQESRAISMYFGPVPADFICARFMLTEVMPARNLIYQRRGVWPA